MNRSEAQELVDSLFATFYSCLVRYAARACGSIEVAEDAVQDSFMALYQELLRGKRIESPQGWALCVVRRQVIKRQREEASHGGALLSLSDWANEIGSSADVQVAVPAEADLTDLLSALSRREEEVILLRIKGLKYRQIANQLGISTNSVKTHLARALKKMRAESQARSGRERTFTEEPYAV